MKPVHVASALFSLLTLSCSSSRPMVAVEYRHGLFGSTEPRSEGIVEVSPQYLVWTVDGRDVFALRSEVIAEAVR